MTAMLYTLTEGDNQGTHRSMPLQEPQSKRMTVAPTYYLFGRAVTMAETGEAQ